MALHGHTPEQRDALAGGKADPPGLSTGPQFASAPAPPLDASQQAPDGGLADFSPGDELDFGPAFATSKQQGAQFFLWRGNLYHTRTADEEANTRELITTQGDVQREEDLANTPLPETAQDIPVEAVQAPVNAPLGAGGPDLAALIQGAQASAPAPGGEIGADFGAMQGIGDAAALAGPGPLDAGIPQGGAGADIMTALQSAAEQAGGAIQQGASTLAGNVAQDFDDVTGGFFPKAADAVGRFRDETVRPALGLGPMDEQNARQAEIIQARRDELGGVLGELNTSASQLFMGNTEPGRALLGRGVSNLKDQIGSDISSLKSLGGEAVDAATQLVSTLPENFKETLEVVEALLTLNEKNSAIPESFRKVQKEFMKAARASAKLPGGRKTREADDFRHFEGAKNAAREAGILPTLVASTAHELRNIVNVLFAMTPDRGEDLGKSRLQRVGEVVVESSGDVFNNLRGITAAGIEKFTGPSK